MLPRCVNGAWRYHEKMAVAFTEVVGIGKGAEMELAFHASCIHFLSVFLWLGTAQRVGSVYSSTKKNICIRESF